MTVFLKDDPCKKKNNKNWYQCLYNRKHISYKVMYLLKVI